MTHVQERRIKAGCIGQERVHPIPGGIEQGRFRDWVQGLGQLPESQDVEQSGQRGQFCVGQQVLGCGHSWELGVEAGTIVH